MSSTESPVELQRVASDRLFLSKIACIYIQRRLILLNTGSITVRLPDGQIVSHHGSIEGPNAELSVRRWRVLWRLLSEGELGLARSYMDDDCDSPDLKALIALGAANSDDLAKTIPNSCVSRWLDQLRHWRRSNTRRGSRKNIVAHYDLGNAFYEQWLDGGMNYSSAIYGAPDDSLERAQTVKLGRIVELLETAPGQSVLEIGSGWGALAETLAQQKVATVTGLTLSVEQKRYARERLADNHGPTTIDFRLQDYRDVEGHFDRIVSIEMIEAVGERYWSHYFQKLRQSLVDTGVVVLQAITIETSRFDTYRRQPDFIQRYIFPGGMLPTVEIIRRHAEQAGFQLVSYDGFGQSYARTLAEWRRRFLRAWPAIEAQGFDTRFKRMWEYYLAYCEVGFETHAIDVGLFKLKPA